MHAICELSAGLTNSDHSTWFTGSDAVRFSTQGELLEEALSIPILLPVSGGGGGGEAWNFSRHLAFSVSYCSWFITPATNLELRSIATSIRPFVLG
jgi:hypothetical protein